MSQAEIIELGEPRLELTRPGLLRRSFWTLQERFARDTAYSKVSFYSDRFSDCIDAYEKEVAVFRERVGILKNSYEEMTQALTDFEAQKRAAQLRLSSTYSLDLRLLGHNTNQADPFIKELSSQEISRFVESLRTDLEKIALENPTLFVQKYSTSQQEYIQAGEKVLLDLEKNILEIEEAKGDLETIDDSLVQLRNRRAVIFNAHKDARKKLRIYENFCRILKSDCKARAQIIGLAISERKLDFGGDALVSMYRILAPIEASSLIELALDINPNFSAELREIAEEQEGRTRALIEVSKEK